MLCDMAALQVAPRTWGYRETAGRFHGAPRPQGGWGLPPPPDEPLLPPDLVGIFAPWATQALRAAGERGARAAARAHRVQFARSDRHATCHGGSGHQGPGVRGTDAYSSAPRGRRTCASSTATTASRGESVSTRYHAPRRNVPPVAAPLTRAHCCSITEPIGVAGVYYGESGAPAWCRISRVAGSRVFAQRVGSVWVRCARDCGERHVA